MIMSLQDSERVFHGRMDGYYIRLVQWITQMNSDNLKDDSSMQRDKNFMKIRANLVSQGIQLATEIKRTLKTFLILTVKNNASTKRQHFPLIVKAIQMLKAIEIEFKTKKYLINAWVILINRYTCELITRLVEAGTQNVYKLKKGFTFDNML